MNGRRSVQKIQDDEEDKEDKEASAKNEEDDTLSDKPQKTGRLLQNTQTKEVIGQDSSPEDDNKSPSKYNLRQIQKKPYNELQSTESLDENDKEFKEEAKSTKKGQRKERKQSEQDIGETIEFSKLPTNKPALKKLLQKTQERLEFYKHYWFQEAQELDHKISQVSETSIPLCADVRNFDFKKLVAQQMKCGGRLFDVIMMDPPWQLSSSQPSRGVAIAYSSLADDLILKLPVSSLQKEGFIFIWVINAKFSIASRLMKQWGYTLVDELAWVKRTVNGKIAKGHGFYLQHAKESCLVGVKGTNALKHYNENVESDILWSERRGQSQKPEEIYDLIDRLVPNGFYLEIFGRRNNLRRNWVTVGNEL